MVYVRFLLSKLRSLGAHYVSYIVYSWTTQKVQTPNGTNIQCAELFGPSFHCYVVFLRPILDVAQIACSFHFDVQDRKSVV